MPPQPPKVATGRTHSVMLVTDVGAVTFRFDARGDLEKIVLPHNRVDPLAAVEALRKAATAANAYLEEGRGDNVRRVITLL